MSNLFDVIAKDPVPDEPEFDDLPAGAWIVAKTADKERGGAAPAVSDRSKQDSPPNYQFRVGLICAGGDGLIKERAHKGQMVFLERWIHPSAEYERVDTPVSGAFMGFLNTVFSPGIGLGLEAEERKQARWSNTLAQLKQSADEAGITNDVAIAADPDFTGTGELSLRGRGLAVAMAAVAALGEDSKVLLCKTKTDNYVNKSGDKVSRTKAGTVEDFTGDNVTKRKVTVFDGEETPAEPKTPLATF